MGWHHIRRMECDRGITAIDKKNQATYGFTFYSERGHRIGINLTRLDLHNILAIMEGTIKQDVSPNQLQLWLSVEKRDEAKGVQSVSPQSNVSTPGAVFGSSETA